MKKADIELLRRALFDAARSPKANKINPKTGDKICDEFRDAVWNKHSLQVIIDHIERKGTSVNQAIMWMKEDFPPHPKLQDLEDEYPFLKGFIYPLG